MNRHQVLTGAANNLEQSVSIGSIENNHFTAYGSGVNIVILASNFDRVQIISGQKYTDSILHCLDCTHGTGKIAAAYGNRIHIFEPTPSANKPSHNFNFKWIHVGSLELDSCISCISWNNESNRVLVGCQSGTIQIWSYNPHSFETTTRNADKKKSTTELPVQFSIYNEDTVSGQAASSERISFHEAETDTTNAADSSGSSSNLFSSTNIFKKVWEKKLANPVKFLKYSPDGALFASFGENDRFVKIWHEVKSLSQILSDCRDGSSREASPIQSSTGYQQGPIEYDYVYLAHPRAVTSVSWRQISKFMPKGMVSNSILTSCLDNICRIWTETIVPDDGLLHTQAEESTYTSITKSAGHKHKLLNKLHKMRAHSHIHLPILRSFSLHDLSHATNLYHRGSKDHQTASHLPFTESNVSSNLSANVRHVATSNTSLANTPDSSSKPGGIHVSASSAELIHQTKHHGQTPVGTALQGGFHFHLAGFIDPEAGIPFHLPNIKSARDANFIVHWANNKDFYFTYLAEAFSKEIYTRLQQYHSEKLRQQAAKSKQSSMDNLDQQPDSHSNSSSTQNNHNMDYLDFMLGLNLDDEAKSLLFGNSIEQKLDAMVKDWYTSHDILFSIHPFDGSVLIWLVDWLDEYMPGSYRQAQVSFHAKLPNSVPVGDAMSLTSSVSLYIEPVKLNNSQSNDPNDSGLTEDDEANVKSNQVDVFMPGVVHLVSKHSNGTLNLWKLQFQENSKYQSLVYVSHLSRVCGHRFLLNSVHSHPILPFLLTNSVNELNNNSLAEESSDHECGLLETFQRGIIIWGVEPVRPLCVTGGIYELARVDSSKPNSFENIAWFPSFLPSSTLGNLSSSPSTLFASTDADKITIYQAVFDARTLLHDLQRQQTKNTQPNGHPVYNKLISTVSATGSTTTDIPYDNFNIVSIQSTARPGCIIELDHLADSAHSQGSWLKADLFHVYQEGLIRSASRKKKQTRANKNLPYQPYSSASAISEQHVFNETFFVVLLEKSRRTNRLVQQIHMWQVNIKSSLFVSETSGDDAESSISASASKNRLTISSQRVCNQELQLPDGVHVVSAETAAADLAASAMFSINQVPYLFATGCSDGVVRFWSCSQKEDTSDDEQAQFEFVEWKMSDLSGSQVKCDAVPLSISCSYNSRFAVAFRKASSSVDDTKSTNNKTFADYCVNIYECESTGGSEWRLEDSICLNSIVLPELDSGINLDYIFGDEKPIKPTRSMHSFKNMIFGGSGGSTYVGGTTSPPHSANIAASPSSGLFTPFNAAVDTKSTPAAPIPIEIPSTAAKISIKRQITTLNTIKPHNSRFKKKAINLDWGSTENGSHILTIGLGNRIFVYSCVMRAKSTSSSSGNDGLIEWKQFRTFELDSADDQQALPSHVKWVREGLLVIGLDTEMQVYSQWSSNVVKSIKNEVVDDTMKSVSQMNSRKPSASIVTRKNASVLDLNKLSKMTKEKKPAGSRLGDDLVSERRESVMDEFERNNSLTGSKQFLASSIIQAPQKKFDHAELLEMMQDSGLFMQAKFAWPVLPQYHPRQLLELMNYGKINRVKAILMHLTRCIIDFELKNNSKVNTQKKLKRKMSVSSESEMPEEQVLNYLEIDTIPPLPLFALFASDNDDMKDQEEESATSQDNTENKSSFDLLSGGGDSDELKLNSTAFDDDFEFDEDTKAKILEKRAAKEKLEFKKTLLASNQSLQNFNSRVCKLLIEYLTCVHLQGLTSIDQMYLVALADTVANVRCDNINMAGNTNDMFAKKDSSSNTTNQIVDNCGLKFLLALRSYNYLIRTLPAPNRAELRQVGLGTANFAWAYHSECEQELLAALSPSSGENESASVLTWSDLRQYGVGWWLKNTTLLKQLIEKVAKTAFQQKNDPLDAALFYLAMKKKGVLWGLFKTVKDVKMSEFFKNDFAEAKWQTAALKNAFVLLGKQRFEHAAAFFLLAGRLKDAVEVCIRSLHDLQLALVIVRLYETDYDKLSHYIKSILFAEVLGYDLLPSVDASGVKKSDSFGQLSAQPKPENISPDAFLRSMSYWYVKDYKQALNTLYDVEKGDLTTYSTSESSSTTTNISQVFNFYTFLKNHPLLIRQQLVDNETKSTKTLMPVERRLHFIAGYYHLVNGCPLLSLDILSKLPKYLATNNEDTSSSNFEEEKKLDFVDNVPKKIEKAADFDWSAPTYNRFNDDEELDLKLDSDEDDEEEIKEVVKVEEKKNMTDDDKINKAPALVDQKDDTGGIVDTFAQQIKFISCLKILIEEMSTLSTGFEVVGGQLRYNMYYWLERETQLLRELGNYGNAYEANLPLYYDDLDAADQLDHDDTLVASGEEFRNSYMLHEHLLRDEKSFQSKVNRLNKRKEWLRSNELLLRTFLSYCSLHSANGAGLTSVKMELVLLMQELVEDRGMKQLLFSPIPLPTTIPLLAASIASSKNMVAGPIKMIKSLSTDVLASLVKINKVPVIFDYSLLITTVKEAAVSLSSCIYQCLCDSDSFTVNDNRVKTGMEGFSRNILYKSSHLMSGLKKTDMVNAKNSGQERVSSSAKTWPGISNLNKLLERDQDNEAPKLKILLFESLVAVYSSLLINAFVFYDCSTLWRLLTKPWSEQMWNRLFGGGCQIEHKYKASSTCQLMPDDENAKQRLKINARLGHKPSFVASSPPKSPRNNSIGDNRVYVREVFVAPEISMINYFMSKPEKDEMNDEDGYDSDEDNLEQSKRDVLDEDPEIIYGKRYSEHINPKSYSWHLMRYAIIKYTIANITSFLPIIGVEFQEIAILSPLIHQIIKTFENWMELILIDLNSLGGPPDDYIPNCSLNTSQQFTHFNGPKILKYQSMLDPANTPFINEKFTYSARRLWHFLVTRKPLHDTFIRYIFKKTKSSVNSSGYTTDTVKRTDVPVTSSDQSAPTANNTQQSSFKIIHKDQEHIYGFCINERDKNMLALCTGKEIIEMDMRNLLARNTPIDDECELDILNLQAPRPTYEQDVYVIGGVSLVAESNNPTSVVTPDQQQKSARSSSISNVRKPVNYGNLLSNPEFVYYASERTRCLIPKILKRPVKEVRRLASHPTLPYYLSGTNESVVKLWHWGSTDPLSTFKQSEKSSAKITKVLFNTHGNKFGVSDLDGQVNLYQLLGCSFKSFLTIRCHQVINDFLFLDSSSIILTAGVSSDTYTVSVWDTLLPASKCQVKCFKEPDASSAICAAYSPLNHLVYCGSRKGEVYIYDIRMHRRLQKFTAHESSVKAIAVDMDECMLATGSSEGNVKTWNLRSLENQHTYHNEHARSSIIRSFNTGVNQLYFTTENQLISCGADGTLVVRKFSS